MSCCDWGWFRWIVSLRYSNHIFVEVSKKIHPCPNYFSLIIVKCERLFRCIYSIHNGSPQSSTLRKGTTGNSHDDLTRSAVYGGQVGDDCAASPDFVCPASTSTLSPSVTSTSRMKRSVKVAHTKQKMPPSVKGTRGGKYVNSESNSSLQFPLAVYSARSDVTKFANTQSLDFSSQLRNYEATLQSLKYYVPFVPWCGNFLSVPCRAVRLGSFVYLNL